MCDIPFTFTFDINSNTGFTYILVGVSSASPNVVPNSSLYSFRFSSFTLNIFLTSENPV